MRTKIQIEKVKQEILESSLPKPLQDKVILALSGLGNNTIRWIFKNVSGSELDQEEFVNFIQSAAKVYQFALGGNLQPAEVLLKESLNNPDWEFGQWAIPLAMDIRELIKIHPNTLHSGLNGFEQKIFRWLPQDELSEIVKSDLLFFVRSLNVSMEFKRIYSIEELVDDGSWGLGFQKDLEGNEEILGKNQIKMDEKVLPPTIKNWILDYLTSSPKAMSERGAYDQIHYIQQSKNTQSLSDTDKNVLLDIIKLHSWFLDPEYSEEELSAYEEELKRKEKVSAPQNSQPPFSTPEAPAAKTFSDVAAAPSGQPLPKPAPVKTPPTIGFPFSVKQPPVKAPLSLQDMQKEIENKKHQAQVMIDQKLDELKEKTK